MVQKILLVGGTGLVGQAIAKELVDSKRFEVSLLVRTATQEKKKDLLRSLTAGGAIVLEGDLDDYSSIKRAVQGKDVVISAVAMQDLLKQIQLVKAAKEAGVKRFIPSDYGVDHRQDPVTSMIVYWKRVVGNHLKQENVPYTFVFSGGFQEWWGINLGDPCIYPPSTPTKVRHFIGGQKFPLVSCPDIARAMVNIVEDERTINKAVFVSGEEYTQQEMLDLWVAAGGKAPEEEKLTEADVDKIIAGLPNQEDMFALCLGLGKTAHIKGTSYGDSVPTKQLYPSLQLKRPLAEYYKQLASSQH